MKRYILEEIQLFLSFAWGVLKDLPRKVYEDKLLFSLVLVFTAIYIPHAFVIVHDLGLIIGYEVDPGSHVSAIEDVLRTYSMHAGYHSKYYGWTYFAINFFLLTPIHIFLKVFGIENGFFLYFPIRLVLFLIGMFALIAFYAVLKKLFTPLLAGLGGALYIVSDAGYKYFYFIHPETTGILFIFLGMLCLLHYMQAKENLRLYFYALFFLVLASLSKHIFFFVSLVILLCFLVCYTHFQKLSLARYVLSREFWRIILKSAAIALITFFFVHPAAFYEIHKFILYQSEFRMFVSGDYAASLSEAYKRWYQIFIDIPLMVFFMITSLIAFIYALREYVLRKQVVALLFAIMVAGILLITFIIATGNRLFIQDWYLQPIYPFLIIYLSGCAYCLCYKLNNIHLRALSRLFFVYFGILVLGVSLTKTLPTAYDRLFYKDSLPYITYDYIQKTMGSEDRLVYDHFVALPKSMKDKGCHYWQGCGDGDYIEEFKPSYVMFNDEWAINDKTTKETKRLRKYVSDHNFKLVETLVSGQEKILVYKEMK